MTVKLGVTYFPTEYSISPADLARAAEERGFESLWVAEHSHIPAARRAPWPGGAELPAMYYDVMDPFVALASAASVTSTIRLGTGICLVAQRDPIQTAKQVASLDRLSGGRFLFGIGAGWNFEEMANHRGHAFERRFKVMRESIEAMKALWRDDPAEYHGEFVDFDPAHARPKPLQRPHPPIHVGGAFPGAARRAIRYGDGWIPILGRGDQDVVSLAPQMFEMAEREGRDPATLEVSVYGDPRDAASVAALRDAGVSRIVMLAPPAPADEVLPRLDAFAARVREAG